jgi:hypothetical protein
MRIVLKLVNMFNRKAKSFVTIMIIIAISALLLRLAIHKLIIFNIEQNQILAQGNLKLFSTALENFAKDNKGVYPAQISQLTKGKPVYLEKDYIMDSPLKGYEYDCQRLDQTGYNCQAVPVNCKLSGKKIYTVSTGGLIIAEDCGKNE